MARITDFCCKTAYQNLSKFFCFRSIVPCFQCFVRGSSPFGKVVSHEPPLLLGNYCLWPPPPPPPPNFHWSSVAGVWIFSGTTHSSKNPHKRQYQVKKTIPANMYNHFHIKLASYWTRTGSTCTCILCYFSSYWMWDEKNTEKKMSIQYEIKQSSHFGTRPRSSFLTPTKWID